MDTVTKQSIAVHLLCVGRDTGAALAASRTAATEVLCFLVRPGLLLDRRSVRPSYIHQRTKETKPCGSFFTPAGYFSISCRFAIGFCIKVCFNAPLLA
jgi:hypothetical protein